MHVYGHVLVDVGAACDNEELSDFVWVSCNMRKSFFYSLCEIAVQESVAGART